LYQRWRQVLELARKVLVNKEQFHEPYNRGPNV